jgi:hypothetical protein
MAFGERCRALDDMSAMLTTTTMRRILVDFSMAQLDPENDVEWINFLSQSTHRTGLRRMSRGHARTDEGKCEYGRYHSARTEIECTPIFMSRRSAGLVV